MWYCERMFIADAPAIGYRDERAPMICSMTCGFGIGMTFSIVAGTPLTWSAFGSFWTPSSPVRKPCRSQAMRWRLGS
jgi:hypothetical protein